MVVPNNNGVFLLQTIILGCFGGTTILGNIHIDDSQLHFFSYHFGEVVNLGVVLSPINLPKWMPLRQQISHISEVSCRHPCKESGNIIDSKVVKVHEYMAQSSKGRCLYRDYINPIHGNCAIYLYPGLYTMVYIHPLKHQHFRHFPPASSFSHDSLGWKKPLEAPHK